MHELFKFIKKYVHIKICIPVMEEMSHLSNASSTVL